MIKVFGLIPCKAGWPREAWLDHYRERHGPLVASVAAFPGTFLAYAQNYVLRRWQGAVAPLETIGISELWARTPGDLAAAFADPGYEAIIKPDESLFTDQDRVRGGVGVELILQPCRDDGALQWARRPRYKLFHCAAAREPGQFARLQEQWRAEAIARSKRDVQGCAVRRHGLTLVRPGESPVGTSFAVVEQWWFDDDAAAERFVADNGLAGQLSPELDALVDPGSRELLLARTHLVFGDEAIFDEDERQFKSGAAAPMED